MADSRWGIIGAVIAAVVMAGCGGASPQQLWEDHTRCSPILYWKVDWSPDGTKIAYSATPGSYGPEGPHIFVLEISNPDRGRMLADSGRPSPVVWSPDGTRIAYTEFADKTIHPAIINADGTGKKILGDVDFIPTAWSPDGRQLVGITRGGKITSIGFIYPDEENPQVIHGYLGDMPDWSPDGKQIVYNFGDVFVTNVDGSGTRTFDGINGVQTTVWSPDGKSIAVESYPALSLPDTDIDILDVATGNITRLATGSSPSWSPDGTQLAFIGSTSGVSAPPVMDIYIISADGTGLTQLTHNSTGGICPH